MSKSKFDVKFRLARSYAGGIGYEVVKDTKDRNEVLRFISEPGSVITMFCNGRYVCNLTAQEIVVDRKCVLEGFRPGFYKTINGTIILHTPGFGNDTYLEPNGKPTRLTLDIINEVSGEKHERIYVGFNYMLNKNERKLVFKDHVITARDIVRFFLPNLSEKRKVFFYADDGCIEPEELDYDIFTLLRNKGDAIIKPIRVCITTKSPGGYDWKFPTLRREHQAGLCVRQCV